MHSQPFAKFILRKVSIKAFRGFFFSEMSYSVTSEADTVALTGRQTNAL